MKTSSFYSPITAIKMKSIILPVLVGSLILWLGGCQDNLRGDLSVAVAGVPPWQYPAGTSEAEIISDARSHLDFLVAETVPGEVLGVVYLKRVLSFEELFASMSQYEFKSGEKASLLVKRKGGGTWGFGFSETVRSESELTARLTRSDPWRLDSNYPGEPVGVSSFMVYGNPSAFKVFWDEHSDWVRLVGVLGTRGHEITNWHPVDVGESLR